MRPYRLVEPRRPNASAIIEAVSSRATSKAAKPPGIPPTEAALLDISRLALEGNVRSLRSRIRNLLRDRSSSGLSDDSRVYLGSLLTSVEPVVQPLRSPSPHPVTRHVAGPPLDERASDLLDVEVIEAAPAPILPELPHHQLQRLVVEREQSDRLRLAGVAPTTTVLLSGPPGVGKTMTARWIAAACGLPLLRLRASSVMSSMMGQSARNLVHALEYARSHESILLLDEFDAYARRRDDSQDIGEPKRLVNSLLLELENWPDRGMLVAATNHLEALDPAIDRRFDLHLRLELPDFHTRQRVFSTATQSRGWSIDDELALVVASATQGFSGSDVTSAVDRAIRIAVLDEVSLERALVSVLLPGTWASGSRTALDERKRAAVYLLSRLDLDVAEAGRLTGLTPRTVASVLRASDQT